MNTKYIARLLALSALMGATLEAIPKAAPTMLPFPENLLDSEVDMIKEIIALEVYQDDNDPNQYFYIPPFHIRQYAEGAATHSPHTSKLQNFADARKEIKDRNKESQRYTRQKLEQLSEDVANFRDELQKAEDKLEDALLAGNQSLIVYLKTIILRKTRDFEDSQKCLADAEQMTQQGQSLLPLAIRREYDRQAIYELNTAGIEISIEENEPICESDKKIDTAMRELADSYGGFLTVNTYAGFTLNQLQALRTYKQKYFPHIKISLMPMEKLTFTSLTNLDPDGQASKSGQRYFTNITGSGDYLGAAITMDTSVGSGTAMEQHMGNFILPVAIRGTHRHKAHPFEAKLTCDFSTGFAVNGRADIRDGLIIYDNDITNNIKAHDFSDGACNLDLINGDHTSAELLAIKEIASELEKIHIYRTNLSQQEKTRYFEGVLSDLDHNRRPNNRQKKIFHAYNRHGLGLAVIESISQVADFHWHTNIQDVANVSNLRFSKHIKLDGDTSITRDIGVNLCLVYNPAHKAYDRCTDLEEASANNMQKAMQEAQNFPGCEMASPTDCGLLRNDSLRLPEGTKRQYNYDKSLVGNI